MQVLKKELYGMKADLHAGTAEGAVGNEGRPPGTVGNEGRPPDTDFVTYTDLLQTLVCS
jgi:hypothetical protein